MTPAYTLIPRASLAAQTSFRVAAQAEILAEVHDSAVLHELLNLPEIRDKPLLVLGGGSNVLFTRDFDGVVVRLNTRGMERVPEGGDSWTVRAAAGENWDGLVRWTLAQDLCGLENLSLIPGRVGAAPLQNIGAYGAELAETLMCVEAYDLQAGEPTRLTREQCRFSYRDSIFKHIPGRWIITAIEMRLHPAASLKLDYAGLREELASMGITQPTATDVANAVSQLRQRKLPDPAVIGNAGSFFKNPLVSEEQALKLRARTPELPVFETVGGKKLSAAWLIEHCGWKGFREGDAGVSEKHALVLVNYGHASGAQIWTLAQRIRDSVQERFGIELEPEPRII